AEMKHGPIALVDEDLPVVFVASRDTYHEKIVSNMQEIKARKGKVLAVVTEGDEITPNIAGEVIWVPQTDELIAPLLLVVPLELLSCDFGVYRGVHVDRPSNLAISVTVG